MDAQKLIDNFSTHLKNVIAQAISTASRLGNDHVEPIHLLHALSQEKGCVAYELLRKHDITPVRIEKNSDALKPFETIPTTTMLPELNPASRRIIEKALILSHDYGHTYIGTEHLLNAIVTSNAKQLTSFFSAISFDITTILDQLDISLQNVSRFSRMNDIIDMLDDVQEDLPHDHSSDDISKHMPPMQGPMNIMPPSSFKKGGNTAPSAIAQFTNNLTAKQHHIKIDPVIGRDIEIERIITILSRRTKNNPILIGEPGVGKTAIVEGLAKRIAEGDVPDILKKKKILSLDLTLLVAGTIYRGEFESRLKNIVDECTHNPNYILFIDEIHNIIGAGSNQGTMDAANILKPALARGQLRCIGATTYDEYTKYITSDPALQRRFQKIDIAEPQEDDTRAILNGIKKYYDEYHHVTITPAAIDEALALSYRYVHDNFQPDKSIDLIDEASSYVTSHQKTSPQKTKLHALEKEYENYIEQKDHAIAEERLKDAIKIKQKLEDLDKKINTLITATKKKSPRPHITEKHVRHVLSQKMHIDEALLNQTEWDNLKTLPTRLRDHIVGQNTAIDTIVQTLTRAQLRTKTTKPLASFLFVGPSGVGKTELAKQLAHELYHDKNALIKLDMSEFAEGHSVSRLLGSPAGYVGYKDRNPLLEKIKQRPYSVLLFDEIDKAHPDVVKLLLQILDEGTISDSNGKKINLSHAVIILTSNIGEEFFHSTGIGFDSTGRQEKNAIHEHIKKRAQESLGTAVMSRITTTCVFDPLSASDINIIVTRTIDMIANTIASRQKITLHADDSALKKLQEKIHIRHHGARHVSDTIEHIIQELLITQLQKKTHKKSYTITYTKDFKLV